MLNKTTKKWQRGSFAESKDPITVAWFVWFVGQKGTHAETCQVAGEEDPANPLIYPALLYCHPSERRVFFATRPGNVVRDKDDGEMYHEDLISAVRHRAVPKKHDLCVSSSQTMLLMVQGICHTRNCLSTGCDLRAALVDRL
jgi:hypothetical protein